MMDIFNVTAAALSNKPVPLAASLPKRVLEWVDANREEWMKMKDCLEFQTVPDDVLVAHTTKKPAQPDVFMRLVKEYEG